MKVSTNSVRFSVGISTFAMAMVLLSSMLIVAFYYFQDVSRARERTVRNVSNIVQQIEDKTRVLASALFLTIDNIVAISSLAESRQDGDKSLRVILTPMFRQNPSITAAYIGYSDGDFSQLVSLFGRDHDARLPYRASADASFAVIRIEENLDGSRARRVQAYAANGTPIGRQWGEPTDFDPRERPWYRAGRATESVYHRTNPYVFSKTRQPGITISRNLSGPELGTAGVDLDLRSLNGFLSDLRLTPSTRLAIVSPNGTLLSHTLIDPVAVKPKANGDVELSLRKLTRASDPVLFALGELSEGTGSLEEFSVDGETHFGQVLGVNLGGAEPDRLLVAVPWSEIAGPLSSARNQALAVTAGLAAFVMIMAIFVGRKLARPIERLTVEAEAIGNLDLTPDVVRINSPFNEIQKLGDAMRAMKSTISVLALYVPRTLVAQLMESGSGGQLGGTRRDLAFLFTDIEGFTTISEKADSAVMMRQLSEYFEVLSNAILHHNGTIDKYIGDAVMAFWNAPRDDLEMASNACKAALRANNGLTTLNIRWDIDGRTALLTRFGLHVGNAMVGNVGCSDRINYTAMGSPVNAAARLEGMNKFFGTTILASDAIRRRTGNMFVWRRIGMVNPKGVLTPLTIFELVGLDRNLPDMPGIPPVKEDVRDFVAEWNAIFEIYVGRQWQDCCDRMTDFLDRHPDDLVAKFYLERVEAYLENPPPPEWNGAEEFSSK